MKAPRSSRDGSPSKASDAVRVTDKDPEVFSLTRDIEKLLGAREEERQIRGDPGGWECLLVVARPGATSVLAPSSEALCS